MGCYFIFWSYEGLIINKQLIRHAIQFLLIGTEKQIFVLFPMKFPDLWNSFFVKLFFNF